jgi:hypothetical protein
VDYTIRRQLTVALQNQPGRLAFISGLLAKHQINIEALALIDNIEQGVIRLIASDPALCKTLLVQEGLYVVEADVLALDLTDSPGKLALLSGALAQAQINIEYAYASVHRPGGKTSLILKVSNIVQAGEVLTPLVE